MKKTLLLSLLVIFSVTCSVAQTITVEDASRNFKDANRPALKVLIPMAEEKMVEKEWKHYIKEYNPEDYKSKKEMFANNLLISRISENKINVYAATEEIGKDGTLLFVSVDMGDAFLNSEHGEKLTEMKKIVKEFALKVVNLIYKEKIEAQEGIVSKANKKLENSIDDKKNLEKEITSYEEKIEENKKEITQLVKDIADQERKSSEEEQALEKLKNDASKVN